jgi:Superinfection immunity protein
VRNPPRSVSGMQGFWVTIGILAITVAYFVPTLVALRRRVTSTGSVIAVNFFLGWTVVGWIVALAMALRTSTTPRDRMPKGSYSVKNIGRRTGR